VKNDLTKEGIHMAYATNGIPQYQSQITTYWNGRSDGYDSHPNHGFRGDREKEAWLATLGDLLPPPPLEILDVGTGTGFLALLLAELGHRVIGIDLAQDMLNIARSKASTGDLSFEIGDASNPAFRPASFDAITSRHLLWTLLDPPTTFANWYRLLRPGGQVLAIDSIAPSPTIPNPPSPYGEELLRALPLRHPGSTENALTALKSACFTVVRAEPLEDLHKVRLELDPTHEPPLLYVFVATRGAFNVVTP
jgi:ubiquinone/menaquinone biosynthesis C-methylase UbiE